MIKAILVDDELNCRKALLKHLEWSCPEVIILASCANTEEANQAIQTYSPDLVFLDIEMPGKNGFSLLKEMEVINFEVIFTTAYDHFALEAFKVHAVDYLMKPIDEDRLVEAVNRVKLLLKNKTPENAVTNLMNYIDNLKKGKKVRFPTSNGLEFIAAEKIIRCEAEGSYSRIFYNAEKPLFLSKTLGQIEALIDDANFKRVHQSHLINTDYIARFVKANGGQIILSDGSVIPISKGKKGEWKEWISRQ